MAEGLEALLPVRSAQAVLSDATPRDATPR
jgi:hypothetical protein